MSFNFTTHPARFQAKIHPGVKVEENTEKEKIEKLHQAGKISANVRKTIASKTKPGVKVLDLCMTADEMIRNEGAIQAFPINISINEIAAHYTAIPRDILTIPDKGVVKVDVGASIDGWIADTAESVDLDGSYKKLVQCTIDATETAIQIIKPGSNTGDIGGVIQKIINDAGFEPIRELSGHLVERYVVHAGKTVPCIERKGDIVEKGEVYAIETFASTGVGNVNADFTKVTIFRASPLRVRPRSQAARKVLNCAIKDFGGMPFSERMLLDKGLTSPQAKIGLKELRNTGNIVEYHVLNETSGGIVSQNEHTMIIKKDGAEVTTRI